MPNRGHPIAKEDKERAEIKAMNRIENALTEEITDLFPSGPSSEIRSSAVSPNKSSTPLSRPRGLQQLHVRPAKQPENGSDDERLPMEVYTHPVTRPAGNPFLAKTMLVTVAPCALHHEDKEDRVDTDFVSNSVGSNQPIKTSPSKVGSLPTALPSGNGTVIAELTNAASAHQTLLQCRYNSVASLSAEKNKQSFSSKTNALNSISIDDIANSAFKLKDIPPNTPSVKRLDPLPSPQESAHQPHDEPELNSAHSLPYSGGDAKRRSRSVQPLTATPTVRRISAVDSDGDTRSSSLSPCAVKQSRKKVHTHRLGKLDAIPSRSDSLSGLPHHSLSPSRPVETRSESPPFVHSSQANIVSISDLDSVDDSQSMGWASLYSSVNKGDGHSTNLPNVSESNSINSTSNRTYLTKMAHQPSFVSPSASTDLMKLTPNLSHAHPSMGASNMPSMNPTTDANGSTMYDTTNRKKTGQLPSPLPVNCSFSTNNVKTNTVKIPNEITGQAHVGTPPLSPKPITVPPVQLQSYVPSASTLHKKTDWPFSSTEDNSLYTQQLVNADDSGCRRRVLGPIDGHRGPSGSLAHLPAPRPPAVHSENTSPRALQIQSHDAHPSCENSDIGTITCLKDM